MKNLKKVLALVVALTMVLGTVAFAAFTDVAVEDEEFTAVSTLSSLGILNGYEDGSFKPDGDITRAEFCAVVCRALGYEAAAGATMFTDVPADHWAAGYINTCAGAGIVNGMGDGTFAPSANVTYEQAVKMLVVALGFEPMAAQKGGYPTGYMVVANTYGMTKDVAVANQAAAATRGVVAQLTYNALDIPMMAQTGFGTNVEYTILDGTKDKDYQTLLTGLGVAKLEGVVVATSKYGDAENGKVSFRIDEANDDEYWEDKIYDKDDDLKSASDRTFDIALAEGISLDDYFQVNAIVYAQEISKNKYEIIAAMPGEECEIVTVALEDIDDVTTEVIEYYASETATKTSKYKLDTKVSIYENYEASKKAITDILLDKEGKVIEGVDMEITLIENSGNSKFDAIIIKTYVTDRVEMIEEDDTAFETALGETFDLDFEDDEIEISIVNAAGEAIEFSEIKENDVIAYLYNEKAGWYEFIVLGESAVTGTVSEIKADAVYIDGTKYISVADSKINLGDEGVFYLTRSGKIFDFEKDASVAGNYAIVLDAGQSGDDFGDGYQVKLLTKNNEIVIYDLRDTLLGTATQTALEKLETKTSKDDIKADIASRLITFKVDSKNNIREITFLKDVVKSLGADAEYDVDAEVLGDAIVPADVVVFNVDVSSLDSVYAGGISYLVNEAVYEGVYVNNDDDEAGCIIITKGGSPIDFTQDLAVISEVTEISINEGADEALKIRYYVSEEDEVKEIIVANDPDITTLVDTTYAQITVGDVFMFTADEEGNASAFAIVANFAANKYAINKTFTDKVEADKNADTTFVYGHIDTYKSVNAGVKVETLEGDSFVVKASANQYTFEQRGSKTLINVNSFRKGDVDKAEDGEANYFFARIVKNSVNDIISVSKRVAVEIEEDAGDAEVPSAGSDAEVPSAGSDAQ